MNENKHTPGPWRVGSKFTDNGVYTADGDIVAATHGATRNFDRDAQIAEQNANARLIAAAPDLLEALQWIVDQGLIAHPGNIVNVAKAAIAKARGQG